MRPDDTAPSLNRHGKPVVCTSRDLIMYPFMNQVVRRPRPQNGDYIRAQVADASRFTANVRR